MEDLFFHRHPIGAFLNILSMPEGYFEMHHNMNLTRWVSWNYGGTVHQDMPENATDQSLTGAGCHVDQDLPDEQQNVTDHSTEADSHVNQDMSENVAEQQNVMDQSLTAADSHQQWPENAIEPQDETVQSMKTDSHTQTVIDDATHVEASSATDLQEGLYDFDNAINDFLRNYDADAMDYSTPKSCPDERFPITD